METGCYGVVEQKTPDSRGNITINHAVHCRCVDIRMKHLVDHSHVMFQRKYIKAGRRDDLAIAIKLRLPNIGVTCTIRAEESVSPAEVDDKPSRLVEETPGGQMLIEQWQSVEAWQTRKIWTDW
ncbi:hypothetical protein F4779DRAFT_635399 [Xylariaceae sp. FL0662B]|nr:hypothetical protein F4779DRAFT_635399 [Xylariaceae sp. FL0662B]